ncbi:hypothetical protein ANCCAN_00736 [Ancylostoma caninum]|uniref:Uncharacterized protein n=1 Tax=Ancylostoma caninum TaxID=29170 RepID=A0A368H9A2_ANCCA|nr:hypothetical protein ANCCAN_00736 [Ancylostoma caninum]
MTPVIYVNIIGADMTGIASVIGMPLTWQVIIVMVLMNETALSTFQLFHYQYRHIVPEKYFLRFRPVVTNIVTVLTYLFGLVCIPAFTLINFPEQDLVKKRIQDKYIPTPESLHSNRSVIIVDPFNDLHPFSLIVVLVYLALGAFACSYFVFSITHYLYVPKISRSPQLLKLQRAVIVELCIKVKKMLCGFPV